jgi:hypothetical protein
LASDGGFFIFMFWYFHWGLEPHLQRAHAGHIQVAGANRRWRWSFRYRGSRRDSAVAQLFSIGHIRTHQNNERKIEATTH